MQVRVVQRQVFFLRQNPTRREIPEFWRAVDFCVIPGIQEIALARPKKGSPASVSGAERASARPLRVDA